MNPHLLWPKEDLDVDAPPPPGSDDLVEDLELPTVVEAMAGGDRLVAETATAVLVAGTGDPAVIRYRQEILRDIERDPSLVSEPYRIAGQTLDEERADRGVLFGRTPQTRLLAATKSLEITVRGLRALRDFAAARAADVTSEGLRELFAMLRRELDDAFLGEVDRHLRQVRFRDGVLESAELGAGNAGRGFVLRQPPDPPAGMFARIRHRLPEHVAIVIPERDEAGARALGELRARGIEHAADAMGAAADDVLAFLWLLRRELAFYLGSLRLAAALRDAGADLCYPEPGQPGDFEARGLYDPSLVLTTGAPAVANDVAAGSRRLLLITGANQGGKSTFLRSVGLAQVMLRAGMWAPAASLRLAPAPSIFSHYARSEDTSHTRGKLDEELQRMSDIVEHLEDGSWLLCNESFASTNEREGSQVAAELVEVLMDAGVRLAMVTHFYELAHHFAAKGDDRVLLLRAERLDDGRRTYRVVPGEPLASSYAPDLYRQVFGEPPDATDSGATGR